MFYLFSVVGLVLLGGAAAVVQAVLTVSAEMDERVDQMRKARE